MKKITEICGDEANRVVRWSIAREIEPSLSEFMTQGRHFGINSEKLKECWFIVEKNRGIFTTW